MLSTVANIIHNRPATHIVNVVIPIDGKNINGKRAADDGELRSSRKRPMLRPAQDHTQDQIFRFLELPAGWYSQTMLLISY